MKKGRNPSSVFYKTEDCKITKNKFLVVSFVLTLMLSYSFVLASPAADHSNTNSNSNGYLLPEKYDSAGVEDSHTVPNILIERGTSNNWAGYAVETNLKSPKTLVVTQVNSSWIVPAVNCISVNESYASFWVGIDGYSSNTVQQIGVDSDCFNGIAQYYAWYEMYPKFPVYLKIKVSPGDLVSADVKYLGTYRYRLTIKNLKTKASYTTNQNTDKGKRSSAEIITEAPSSSYGRVLGLANFNNISFINSSVTINGITGGINNTRLQFDKMDMKDNSGVIKAQTSDLINNGKNFNVKWLRA